MPGWTHAICERCWVEQNTDEAGRVRVPVRLLNPTEEVCCFCGYPTWAGIFVRRNPTECIFGVHGEGEDGGT